MELDRIDVSKLDVPVRTADLRRDLHVFVDFVRERAVKRGHRDNLLNKADAKRLAKLLSYKPPPEEQEEDEYSAWMGFVDDTALRLGFVKYDTEGEYAGYTSSSKSYPENYIEFSAPGYQRFLAMKAAKQEMTLLDLLLGQRQGSESEFYAISPLGRLDRFTNWGSATGVMPLLDFAAIRRFLLALLVKCPTGQWLSTASLLRHLNQNHRYFLIPQKPLKDKWGNRPARYGRSDRKDQPRVPITARLVADMIEIAGADRYMTFDPHAGQVQGFFSIPGDVLTASHMISDYIKDNLFNGMVNPVVVATDLGFAKKGRNYALDMDIPIAFIEKRRVGNEAKAEALTLIGDVHDRDVIIVDDEVDTGGSVAQAVNVVKQHGARDVYLAFIHPIFSKDAAEKLASLPIKQIVTTDTVPIPEEKMKLLEGRITILSIASMLGEVIQRAHEGRSVGEMFNE